jgi:hypothetical protein
LLILIVHVLPGLAPVASQLPMLSGASIWGQGEKAWRSQTLLHHPDPEPNVTTLLKGSSLTKKVFVLLKQTVIVLLSDVTLF